MQEIKLNCTIKIITHSVYWPNFRMIPGTRYLTDWHNPYQYYLETLV